jgi:YtkA-like protein
MPRNMLTVQTWLGRALILAACALAALACKDDEGDDHDHGDHDHGADGCGNQANCDDTVELADGLRVPSENDEFTVEIVSHTPLSVADNEWTIAIEDADGNAVTDAELSVDVFSVDCMHPGPDPVAHVSANADGEYELAPVHLHGGPWDTVIEIEAGGA